MGETGCGKTRLVKFLCDLQRYNINIYSDDDNDITLMEKDEAISQIKNLFLLKVCNLLTLTVKNSLQLWDIRVAI